MKMVMISVDNYEKLLKVKEESETKIESYKQCIAGYESRIKELTEECDKFKDQYRSSVAKRVLNSAYGVEQDICCRISKILDASMFDKITELSNENEKLKIKTSSLETQLKDCKDMYENKLKNTEATLKAVAIGNKELRQKYEAVLKSNENLSAENSRLANDPEITRLNNELNILKKQYRDLNNAYKSQKNELLKLKNKPDDKYDILREQYNCLYIDYERVKLIRKEYEDRLNKIESLANV